MKAMHRGVIGLLHASVSISPAAISYLIIILRPDITGPASCVFLDGG